MNLLFLLTLFLPLIVQASPVATAGLNPILSSESLKLTRSDIVIAEHMVNMLKFAEKGYLNQEILNKVLSETAKSKHFLIFHSWLSDIRVISKLNKTSDFINHCRAYQDIKQTLPLEKVLEKVAGNYCRERTLEAIGREIDKTQKISDEATIFIQQNLKFFLTKKNKKNFAYFVQSQSSKPEILKKLSQEVTTYSVRNEIIPSQEVLQDILINEQITKLIQDKGFNPLQHQNVFYAEFGKLIEMGYKALENNPPENKVQAHFNYLKNYLELNQDHLPVGLCLTRLNDFSKSVFRNGHKDLSRDIYKYIIKKNNKDIQEDAIFFYLWTHLYYNEFKEAKKLAEQLGLIKNSKELLDARLKFWIAYIQEELGQKSEAISLYEDIVFNHSLSYYGIMSTKKLQALKPESAAVTFYTSNSVKTLGPASINMSELDEDHISSLVRLKAWSKIDSAKFMGLELERLNGHSLPTIIGKTPSEKQLYVRSDLHILNGRLIEESDNYLAAFRYLYQALDKKEVIFNRQLLEILYPQPFINVLTKELRNQKLDPIVILSLIRQESVFNPLAKSRVGARGLMQLMPTTARQMRKSVRDNHLTNPQINIELGIKYFTGLMKRYDNNLVYVLSAYNAGETRVERWKKLYFNEDDTILKNVESIPFLETRNYVKLISRNIFFYKLLLDDKKEIVDSREPNKIFDINLGFQK